MITRRDFFVTTAVAGVAATGVGQAPPPVPPEALARYEWILRKWGANFTDEQKVDIMRMIMDNERSLVTMRAFPLSNGTEPAK
jgi:hypothetical protein